MILSLTKISIGFIICCYCWLTAYNKIKINIGNETPSVDNVKKVESNNFEKNGSNVANSESKTIDKNKLLCAFSNFNSKSNLNQTPFTKITRDEMNNIEVIEDKVEVDDK